VSGKRDPLRRIILFPEASRTDTGDINRTKLASELFPAVGIVGEGMAIVAGTIDVALDVAAGTGLAPFVPTGWFWTEITVEFVGLRK